MQFTEKERKMARKFSEMFNLAPQKTMQVTAMTADNFSFRTGTMLQGWAGVGVVWEPASRLINGGVNW